MIKLLIITVVTVVLFFCVDNVAYAQELQLPAQINAIVHNQVILDHAIDYAGVDYVPGITFDKFVFNTVSDDNKVVGTHIITYSCAYSYCVYVNTISRYTIVNVPNNTITDKRYVCVVGGLQTDNNHVPSSVTDKSQNMVCAGTTQIVTIVNQSILITSK